jgi:hypothetical protein
VQAAEALIHLAPDVIVLTEYVSNATHRDFRQLLTDSGLACIETSSPVARHNQVLLASRWPLLPGTVRPDPISPATIPNWLHVRIPARDIEVVGFRAPMFKTSALRQQYWDWLEAAIGTISAPVVAVGDMNVDPAGRHRTGAGHLARLSVRGWQVASPQSGWSFRGKTGLTSRIDHALVSRNLRFSGCEYVEKTAGFLFAGPGGYSDHAVLCLHVGRAN